MTDHSSLDAGAGPAVDSLRILIVEDNDSDYLLLLRRVHKSLPTALCERAADRAEVTMALRFDWNLIISDLHLGDIEGEDLLQAIAAAHPLTPCLVLSGSLNGFSAPEASRADFRFLEKGDSAGLQAVLDAVGQGL